MPADIEAPVTEDKMAKPPVREVGVQGDESGKYRLQYYSPDKPSFRFNADSDEAALKIVADHLGIPYPFVISQFITYDGRYVSRDGDIIYPLDHHLQELFDSLGGKPV